MSKIAVIVKIDNKTIIITKTASPELARRSTSGSLERSKKEET